MATQTPQRRSASQMTARTGQFSSPSSPLAVPCASCPPLYLSSICVLINRIVVGSVTTVGGTESIPEVAAPFSGGGFSNYVSTSRMNSLLLVLCNYVLTPKNKKFARPAWQTVAVQNYLDNLPSNQYQGLFNPCVSFLSPFPSSFNPSY